MNIDDILARGDFQPPLFAEFILDKYKDIKETDPESAAKIEARVFTPLFLESILQNGPAGLKFQILTEVPPEYFPPLVKAVKSYLSQSDSVGGSRSAARVLKAISPGDYLDGVEKRSREYIDTTPVSMENFYWLDYLQDLPDRLRQEFLDRSMALFKENLATLEKSPSYGLLVGVCLSAAVRLEHSDTTTLAKIFMERLAKEFDPDEEDVSDFISDIFFRLAPEINGKKSAFEMNLALLLEDGRPIASPALLGQIYAPGPGGCTITESLRSVIEAEDSPDIMAHLPSTAGNKTCFRGNLIKALARDRRLLGRLAEKDLVIETALTLTALLWQLNRNDAFDPRTCSDEALGSYLCLNIHHLPFSDRITDLLDKMEEGRQEDLLAGAMAQTLQNWETSGDGFYATANILEIMAALKRPAYLPLIAQTFLWEGDPDEVDFHENSIKTVSAFGDRIFELLDPIMERIPEPRLLDVLDVIRRLASPAAEDFLLNHFERFMSGHRADTLEACQAILSQKALELVAHKVGKGQSGIDRLFVLVKTFCGESGPEVERILEDIDAAERSIQRDLESVQDSTPRTVLKLELQCSRCGDVNHYHCRNIILSPSGEAYVAEELTCIGCDRISEFSITASGLMGVQAEAIRTLGGDDDQESPPGAVKLMSTAVMGSEMSIPQGIARYKEKIRQHPQSPEHYIGLGNIYKASSQNHLAREQYETAIQKGPFYIEAYLNLAAIAQDEGESTRALDWLEKGRPFLIRPLICKAIRMTGEELMDTYLDLHLKLIVETGARIPAIRGDECMDPGRSLTKIGRNEKCPCGSGKKYKKCCMRRR